MWFTEEQRGGLLVEAGRLYLKTYCRLAQQALERAVPLKLSLFWNRSFFFGVPVLCSPSAQVLFGLVDRIASETCGVDLVWFGLVWFTSIYIHFLCIYLYIYICTYVCMCICTARGFA